MTAPASGVAGRCRPETHAVPGQARRPWCGKRRRRRGREVVRRSIYLQRRGLVDGARWRNDPFLGAGTSKNSSLKINSFINQWVIWPIVARS